MSKIYKFNHIIDNEIKTIYIFSKKDLNKTDEGISHNDINIFTDEEWSNIKKYNIPYQIIKEDIYSDDTIQSIKEKMVSNIKLDFSTFEIYLFACVNKKINLSKLYDEITQKELLELDYNKLSTVFKNFRLNTYDFKTDFVNLIEKETYSYEDITSLDLPETNIKLIPLGQSIMLKKNYPLGSNPFHNINMDSILKLEGSNMISTQNKYLLFTFGEIIDNNINFCLAKDVIGYSEEKFRRSIYI